MRVQEVVDKLGGRMICGNGSVELTGVAGHRTATRTELVFAENSRTLAEAIQSEAGVVVTGSDVARPEDAGETISAEKAIVEVEQPRLWFAQAAKLLDCDHGPGKVDARAVVADDAVLGEGCSVGPCAVIGRGVVMGPGTWVDAGAIVGDGVKLGASCHLYPRAVLYPGVEIGERVVIHAGAVLGADGFGYVRDKRTGAYTQFPQQGRLVIEDDVEIGANTTIDRGALDETRIRRGVKIDNLVHIGHNCHIGEDVVIVAGTGISGSSTVGKGAVLAGQVGIGDHAHVGPGVILGGQAGVLSGKSEMRTGTVLWGTPAKPLREHLRELATLAKLAAKRGKTE